MCSDLANRSLQVSILTNHLKSKQITKKINEMATDGIPFRQAINVSSSVKKKQMATIRKFEHGENLQKFTKIQNSKQNLENEKSFSLIEEEENEKKLNIDNFLECQKLNNQIEENERQLKAEVINIESKEIVSSGSQLKRKLDNSTSNKRVRVRRSASTTSKLSPVAGPPSIQVDASESKTIPNSNGDSASWHVAGSEDGHFRTDENICAACSKPIRERYLLVALDKRWHEDCLKCACCDCRLGEVGSTLFTRSGKLLCRRDFLRIFGQHGRCAACRRPIPPYELVMRANEHAYHLDCFACQQCQYRFCVGDRFHLADTKRVVCVLCFNEGGVARARRSPELTTDEAKASRASTTSTSNTATSLPRTQPAGRAHSQSACAR